MRKIIAILAAVVLLSSAAWSGAEEKNKAEQLRIFDQEIKINLDERGMEVSFRYEEVAGHIDDARKIIVLGITPASGGMKFIFIPLKVTDSRGERKDGITPNVITQGRVRYHAIIPNGLEINDANEVVTAGIAVVDGLGRKGEAILVNQYLEEKEAQKKLGI